MLLFHVPKFQFSIQHRIELISMYSSGWTIRGPNSAPVFLPPYHSEAKRGTAEMHASCFPPYTPPSSSPPSIIPPIGSNEWGTSRRGGAHPHPLGAIFSTPLKYSWYSGRPVSRWASIMRPHPPLG